MPLSRDHEAEIDKLYRLPVDEFTAARNALVKIVGVAGREIKGLPKPSIPAWAVNQLYWSARPTYDALVRAAERLREAHRAVIGGQKADIKGATAAHQAGVDDAVNKASATVENPTTATRDAIRRTIEALPTRDTPGRLAHALEPPGFEILEGLAPRKASAAKPVQARTVSKPSREALSTARKQLAAAEGDLHRAREAQRHAARTAKAQLTRLEAAQDDEKRARAALERAVESRQALERDIERLRFEARATETRVVEAEREAESVRERVRKLGAVRS